MNIVTFKSTKVGEQDYRGEIQVRGYKAVDYGPSPEDVKTSLISHLLDEQEIKEGEYILEETPIE